MERTRKGLEPENFTPVRKGKLLTRGGKKQKAPLEGWREHDARMGRGMKEAGMEDVKTAETPKATETQESSKPMEVTNLGEDIGDAASQAVNSPEPAEHTKVANSEQPSGVLQLGKFLIAAKIAQRTWLIAATVLLGLVALLMFSRMQGRNQAARARQVERRVESATPESVIAACGQPAEDVTKDLYPMIKRTMTYRPAGKAAVVLEFSRTAEEHSEWLFLPMKDENGPMKYETPETQVAALPCLGK